MPAYEVLGGATTVRVQGDNWLSALGASLEYFGLDSGAVARLAIDVRPDGSVNVADPVSGRAFTLQPAAEIPAATVDLSRLAGTAVMEVDAPAPTLEPVEESIGFEPPPSLTMPGQSLVDDTPPPPPPEPAVSPPVDAPLVQKPSREDFAPPMPPAAAEPESDRPDDLAETLFDLSFEIMMANDVGEACQVALDTMRGLVEAEAGAVLYGDINSVGLTFMSAYGPAAGSLQGKTISFETGIAGFCHQHGVGLIIHDTVTDERHDKSVDEAVGFQTRSILAVAILSPGRHTYGCLELLNSPGGFKDWHLEAAQTIAGSLGDFVWRRESS